MEKILEDIVCSIQPLSREAMNEAQKRQAALAKPPGSLGELENISIRLAGITGNVCTEIQNTRIIVFCADNGIIEEGVSCSPRSVTATQACNMTKYLTGMSAMAKYFGDDVFVVDVGIADEYENDKILNRNILKGTRNFAKESALTRKEVLQAIQTGIDCVSQTKNDGFDLIGIGEMGIGNTSTSSAVLVGLTGLSVSEVTGRGGGLNDDAFLHKKTVIENALNTLKPDMSDPIDVLAKVGGLDIAAMCGAFLGAAKYRIPVVIDGFISVVAALCAKRICGLSADYMFPSHASFEIGYMRAIEELGLHPWLMMNMRLGEGSGCPLAFQILKAACAVMNGMASFGAESSINDSYLEEIRKYDSYSVK